MDSSGLVSGVRILARYAKEVLLCKVDGNEEIKENSSNLKICKEMCLNTKNINKKRDL